MYGRVGYPARSPGSRRWPLHGPLEDEMGIQNLPIDEQTRVYWVIDWIARMGQKYDGIVYEKTGKKWDWGQALCRECYGPDWNDIVPESPSWEDIERAKRWETGEIPDWVNQELTQRKDGH